MTARSSARWRPPNGQRSLSYHRWMSWARLAFMAMIAAMVVRHLVAGGNVLVAVLSLFVVAFVGSDAIWRLQGIHAIERDRRRSRSPDSAG